MSKPLLAIEVNRLTKTFRNFRALDDLTLSIPQGSLFGLLGPNGAGKTTLLRTLLGYIKPSSGTASIFGNPIGLDTVAVRMDTAYLPAEAKLFRMMRGNAVLRLFAELHPKGNLETAKNIAVRLKLDLTRMVGFMSTGMRQKLAIACVLGTHSPLVILDEPTANLDPTVRKEVLQLIREAHQRGSTVVFSSHLLDEIEELCDHAAIIKGGQVRKEVDLSLLRATYRAVVQSSQGNAPEQLPPGVDRLDELGEGTNTLRIDTAKITLDEALRALTHRNEKILHIEPLGLRTIYESCSESC